MPVVQRLLVLFGSETGNAQDVADTIGREATRRHFAPVVLPADGLPSFESLDKVSLLVLVVATAGQGEMPQNIKRFWKFLLRKKLPGDFLRGVHYAVFGLGDSSYPQYNVAAKKVDRRLLDVGANPLLPRGLGDDQHPCGYEAALDPWLLSLWAALRERCPLPAGVTDPSPSEFSLPLGAPKLHVTLLPPAQLEDAPSEVAAAEGSAGVRQGNGVGVQVQNGALAIREAAAAGVDGAGVEAGELRDWVEWSGEMSLAVGLMDRALGVQRRNLWGLSEGETATAELNMTTPFAPVEGGRETSTGSDAAGPHKVREEVPLWERAHPYLAALAVNRRLTAEDHSQDVRHLELDLSGSGIQYSPGDVVHVWPAQSAAAVTAFLHRCGLDPDARVLVESSEDVQRDQGTNSTGRHSNSHGVRLFDLVAATLDVDSASPRRFFFQVLSQFAADEREQEKLAFFASVEGRDELYEYNQRERRTVLEVLEEFVSVSVPLHWLLQICPRMRPRTFSISSSLRAHPAQCHITVAVVSHQTPFKRIRWGLCSRWLSLLQPQHKGGPLVPVWVTQGTLQLPPPSVPVILVGPGTGCAPFRAFIQERSALLHENAVDQAPDGTHSNWTETTTKGRDLMDHSEAGRTAEVVAPVLFFFGCRYRTKDYLYKDEWEHFSQGQCAPMALDGGGGFFVAFSRDQPKKVYVQHKLREQGTCVWNSLKQGAIVFIAGSANKMPADVLEALVDVVAEEGLMEKVVAQQWIKSLQRLGRVYIECWS